MKRKYIYRILFTLTFVCIIAFNIIAQPGAPGGGGGAGDPVGGAAGVPLDGGIFSLLLAGIGILAVRRQKRKKA